MPRKKSATAIARQSGDASTSRYATGTNGITISGKSTIPEKKMVLDVSESESDDDEDKSKSKSTFGGDNGDATVGFKINEEYAKRFEHNKKREELQRCQFTYIFQCLKMFFILRNSS